MGTKINYNRKRNEEETDRREILWTYNERKTDACKMTIRNFWR